MLDCCEPRCFPTRVILTLLYAGFALYQWNDFTFKYAAIVFCLGIALIVGIERCLVIISMICAQKAQEINITLLFGGVYIINLFTNHKIGMQNQFLIISEWVFLAILFLNLGAFLLISLGLLCCFLLVSRTLQDLIRRNNQTQQLDDSLQIIRMHSSLSSLQSIGEALQACPYQELQYKKFTTCPICLVDFNAADQVSKLQVCEHYFHQTCIQTWLQERRNCPCCRTAVHFF